MIRDANRRAVDFRTKMVNPQFERLTGVPAAEAVARTARELVGELEMIGIFLPWSTWKLHCRGASADRQVSLWAHSRLSTTRKTAGIVLAD